MNESVGSGGARAGTSVDATVEKCPRCFAELVRAWQFCPSCGLPLDPALSSDGQVTSTSISYVRRPADPPAHKRPSLTESLVQSGLHLLVLVAFIGIGVGGIIVLSPGVLRSLVSPIGPDPGQPTNVPLKPLRESGYASLLPGEFVPIEAEVFTSGDPDVKQGDPKLYPADFEGRFRDFEISRFEITNYQFLRYLEWRRENDPDGFTWSQTTELFAEDWRDEDRFGQPVPARSQYTLPVRGVTFDEAQEFAHWAGEQLGATIRLPYWYEWEKAARGTDGRRYPWGNEWDRRRCNTREHGVGGPVPGSQFGYLFPADGPEPEEDDRDASPDEVFNLAGNVSEWVDSTDSTTKYVMGGAYDADRYYAQVWVKNPYPPTYRARYLGFRVIREVEEVEDE